MRCLVIACLAVFALAGIMSPEMQAAQEPSGFVFIRGGEFAMGSPAGEVGRVYDETRRQVKVGDFYLSICPVTVAGFCRSASRHNDIAANRYNYVGFGVVLVP